MYFRVKEVFPPRLAAAAVKKIRRQNMSFLLSECKELDFSNLLAINGGCSGSASILSGVYIKGDKGITPPYPPEIEQTRGCSNWRNPTVHILPQFLPKDLCDTGSIYIKPVPKEENPFPTIITEPREAVPLLEKIIKSGILNF